MRLIVFVVLTFGGSVAVTFGQDPGSNLIVNGGFESPDISGWRVFGTIPGWTTFRGRGIEVQDHCCGSPFRGRQHVELDSWNNSGMEQSVSTIPGRRYLLSFAYSPRPGRAANSNGISVFADGSLLAALSESGTGLADTTWSRHGFFVTASGPTTEIRFMATGHSDTYGGYIDDVSFIANSADFSRGDVNGDGVMDISDAIVILRFLFLDAILLDCEKAGDVDDSGTIEITDAVYSLRYNFLGAPVPPSPFGECAEDPTPDTIPCDVSACP